jgi:small subunit ribosomal protein S4
LARYTGPVCRLCRREGVKLFLKGHRCYSPKCPIEKRANPPGQHGDKRPKRTSDFRPYLREKQKVRRIYGVLERQFRRYFRIASKAKGATGSSLLILLERRLDNVVFRLGFASSRPEARQMVRHGHVTVNGRRVNIPSYSVREGDVVAIAEKSRSLPLFKDRAAEAESRPAPAWLQRDLATLSGTVLRLPTREDLDPNIQERLIVEYYSR